jgi:NADPH:quinone reductase-like Zn-dependent oxidoreductase
VIPDSRRSQISAFGLNRSDLNQREGMYPPPPGASHILGVEFSGIVHELGLGVTKWSLGDEVYGLVGGVWISESPKSMTESHDFFCRDHTPSTLYVTKVY